MRIFVTTAIVSSLILASAVGMRHSDLLLGAKNGSVPTMSSKMLDLRAYWYAFDYSLVGSPSFRTSAVTGGVGCNVIPNKRSQGESSQRLSIESADSCSMSLLSLVESWTANDRYQEAFDTMRYYLTHCYNNPNPESAWNAFVSSLDQSVIPNDEDRIALRAWLLSIRNLNPAPEWWCNCVGTIGITYNDIRSSLAILRFLMGESKCSKYYSDYSTGFTHTRQQQYSIWADTVKDPNHAVFDTTLPSMHDLGLDSVLKDAAMFGIHSPGLKGIMSNVTITPNPVLEGSVITFGLSRETFVHIDLFDLLGNKASSESFESVLEKGNHSIPFSLHALPSGTYFARIQTTYGEVQTVKLVKE
jgi:hypothetical protein